jgi:hypothetical protein
MARTVEMGKKELPALRAHQVKTAKMDRTAKTGRMAKMVLWDPQVHQVGRHLN